MLGAPKKLGRRELLHASWRVALGALAFTGCKTTGPPVPVPVPVPGSPPSLRGEVDVWSVFDLPTDDPRGREISGASWEEETRTLWTVQDELGAIVPLHPAPDLQRWTFGESIQVDAGGPPDLEGVAGVREGFLPPSEEGPPLTEG